MTIGKILGLIVIVAVLVAAAILGAGGFQGAFQ